MTPDSVSYHQVEKFLSDVSVLLAVLGDAVFEEIRYKCMQAFRAPLKNTLSTMIA